MCKNINEFKFFTYRIDCSNCLLLANSGTEKRTKLGLNTLISNGNKSFRGERISFTHNKHMGMRPHLVTLLSLIKSCYVATKEWFSFHYQVFIKLKYSGVHQKLGYFYITKYMHGVVGPLLLFTIVYQLTKILMFEMFYNPLQTRVSEQIVEIETSLSRDTVKFWPDKPYLRAQHPVRYAYEVEPIQQLEPSFRLMAKQSLYEDLRNKMQQQPRFDYPNKEYSRKDFLRQLITAALLACYFGFMYHWIDFINSNLALTKNERRLTLKLRWYIRYLMVGEGWYIEDQFQEYSPSFKFAKLQRELWYGVERETARIEGRPWTEPTLLDRTCDDLFKRLYFIEYISHKLGFDIKTAEGQEAYMGYLAKKKAAQEAVVAWTKEKEKLNATLAVAKSNAASFGVEKKIVVPTPGLNLNSNVGATDLAQTQQSLSNQVAKKFPVNLSTAEPKSEVKRMTKREYRESQIQGSKLQLYHGGGDKQKEKLEAEKQQAMHLLGEAKLKKIERLLALEKQILLERDAKEKLEEEAKREERMARAEKRNKERYEEKVLKGEVKKNVSATA